MVFPLVPSFTFFHLLSSCLKAGTASETAEYPDADVPEVEAEVEADDEADDEAVVDETVVEGFVTEDISDRYSALT